MSFEIKSVKLKYGLGFCDRLRAFAGELSSSRSREAIYNKVNSSSLFSLLYKIELTVADAMPKQLYAGWIIICVK